MAENENASPDAAEPGTVVDQEAVEPEPAAAVAAPAPAAPATAAVAATGPRLRDTVWNFRSMVAVALASLLIGGSAGAAIVALADDDHPDRARIVVPMGQRFDRGGPFSDQGGLPGRRWQEDGSQPGPPEGWQNGPGDAPAPGQQSTPSAPQSGSAG